MVCFKKSLYLYSLVLQGTSAGIEAWVLGIRLGTQVLYIQQVTMHLKTWLLYLRCTIRVTFPFGEQWPTLSFAKLKVHLPQQCSFPSSRNKKWVDNLLSGLRFLTKINYNSKQYCSRPGLSSFTFVYVATKNCFSVLILGRLHRLWLLVLLIAVSSHYSSTVAKLIGSTNPVSVLVVYTFSPLIHQTSSLWSHPSSSIWSFFVLPHIRSS